MTLASSSPLLSVQSVNVEIQSRKSLVRPVKNMSFDVYKGDRLGIVGESGSGKSMTSLTVMGLLPPRIAKVTSGEILFTGRSLLNMDRESLRDLRGKDIAMIFQNPMSSLNPYLTIGTQLTEGYLAHFGGMKAQAKQRAIDMLKRVGIPDPQKRMRSYPHELSGGMRQRAMIAIGLMCSPQLLIADEPTSALDVTIQAQIIRLLEDLQQEFDMSVMLITHDIGLVAEFCNKVAVVYAGSIVEFGEVEDIFYRPKHPYTMGLLDSVPSLHLSQNDPLRPIKGAPPNLASEIHGCPFAPRCRYGDASCLESFPAERQTKPGHRYHCIKDIEYQQHIDKEASKWQL